MTDADNMTPTAERRGNEQQAAAIVAANAPARTKPSNYPAPFASRMAGRTKQALGDGFGIKNFGVNRTTLAPGAVSSLHHCHSLQDEFIYILEETPTLITSADQTVLSPGMVAGFPAAGTAHHLENRTDSDCVLLEVGDRTAGDLVNYPSDDLKAVKDADGGWRFTRKDGTDFPSGGDT